ncbi:hypothetical protein DFH09DRAFT_382212 [Mycena vulgaris]|nr:hypothetical protein DFH09DRAFT_382212 [Mycena vulgaris]
MTRRATLLVLLVVFTPLFQGAPLAARALGVSRISSSTSPPRPSPSKRNTTSPPPVTNWAAYGNDTTGFALHQLLNRIGPDAPQRWVTVEIASTQIGSADPAGSNADLSAAADTADVGGPPGFARWVDTYIKFLIETGRATDAVDDIMGEQNRTTEAWAAAQAKLVRAYEAAHPGNITNVGVDIAGVASIDAVTMGQIIGWASRGGDVNCTANLTLARTNETHTAAGAASCTFDSDGPYTAADYQNYSTVTAAYNTLQTRIQALGVVEQMALHGYHLRNIFPKLGIFNLSMDVGGSGASTQFAPAWSATITGFAMKSAVGFGAAMMETNLESGPGESTVNETGSVSGMFRRDAGGFSALQGMAHGLPTRPKSDGAPKMAAAAALSSADPRDPLDQPLPEDQSFVLLNLKEGSWADRRDEFVHAARQTVPDVVDKYFGPRGPLARRWTHLVLRASFDVVNGSTRVGLVELFGRVYEVLPV